MKKLVLFAAVILSMSAISCGNGEKGAAADSVDSTAKDTTEVAAPAPAAADTVAPVAADSAVKA